MYITRPHTSMAPAHGLYDPSNEHDSCGLALIARFRGGPDHEVLTQALSALRNMEHRGGVGGDQGTGDGAGLTTNVPHAFLSDVTSFDLPEFYAVGIAFLDPDNPGQDRANVERICREEGLDVLGWRPVEVNPEVLGDTARNIMPLFEQLFVTSADVVSEATPLTSGLNRKAFVARKRCEHEGVYFPSLNSSTLTYKGMLTTAQLGDFYVDLSDERYVSRIGLVHSRFSTNTFPSWALAQPFRMLAHNGEINTVRGNRNWMAARESTLESPLLASPNGTGDNADLSRFFPILTPGASDSASFDEVCELLVMAGRSLPHVIAMMIPETWEKDPRMSEERKAFYEYHSALMEPWDGPASIGFTDGVIAGGVLDRNGLRPARYVVTDTTVVLASEVGVVDLDPQTIVKRGRLKPGRMFVVDTLAGEILSDTTVKTELAKLAPYEEWVRTNSLAIEDLPSREHVFHPHSSVARRQKTFGFTEEDLKVLIEPMAKFGAEPLGAMGTDTPIAALSNRPRMLFDYFVQSFAQVTNPPLDAIRESVVTSLSSSIGTEKNLLTATGDHAVQIRLHRPVISNDELAKIIHLKDDGRPHTRVLRSLFAPTQSLTERLERLCREAENAVADGIKHLVLSDRGSNAELAPVPSLLATSAIHHHLIKTRQRTKASLVVEAGDVREVHHVATLIGFGASAVNPYLAMESAELLVRDSTITEVSEAEAVANLLTALNAGLLKIMSKMGISTVQSYHGAQTFSAVGLSADFLATYFGVPGRLGDVGIDEVARDTLARHASAYPKDHPRLAHRRLDPGGEYQWNREGPPHLLNPTTISLLQWSTRRGDYDLFKKYSHAVNDQAKNLMTVRGLMDFVPRTPVPLSEVEPVEAIVTRFSTGAMSYGSLSQEAHETLAVAMNRIGAKSNTGEGGEDTDRLLDPTRRSAIKQVASGRFGVTSMYLTHADDIQIKMAQGAKPGEGGQLPGSKMYPWIASTRHSTPGVGLISPPPHHDIYSIEDLAQLIHDLGRANPDARVHVKLVANHGVGTVATGVAKAGADVVLISGHDGGTGASPLNSLKHAGEPWEFGLAETQQTLLQSGLRGTVTVQVDGQLKTGRDVVVAALLGAEEFGFATAPLVVAGCVMMRVCHKDTCPVGVATQNPTLRERFTGDPDHVVNFFRFIAQEVRELLASLGLRSLDEAIGRVELLRGDDTLISQVLAVPQHNQRARTTGQLTDRRAHFDASFIPEVARAAHAPVTVDAVVTNVDRSVGTLVGHEITREYGALDNDALTLNLTGYAGQSLGAFIPQGLTLNLTGDANDYVGKGLSGGIITARPHAGIASTSIDAVIAGNVVGYGATSGKVFLAGQVGERFFVRNSGAVGVVEGCGDHGLEYMTGGTALILGSVGRNFAAGMSGGTAYLLDFNPARVSKKEHEQFIVSGLSSADIDVVVELLTEHARRTGSHVATTLLQYLDEGEDVMGRFTKVQPRTFKLVQEILQTHDSSESWDKILEVTHG